MLGTALKSVLEQQLPPNAIIVEIDKDHTGAAATKNRALSKVTTEWVAFLDDDDEFWPSHLKKLARAQKFSGADMVYSMPYIPQQPDHHDPMGRRGQPFDADELRRRSYIQTTSLIRTASLKLAGGFQLPDQNEHPGCPYDDWGAWLAMLDRGASFYHLPVQTFVWNHWGGNTSGEPHRW